MVYYRGGYRRTTRPRRRRRGGNQGVVGHVIRDANSVYNWASKNFGYLKSMINSEKHCHTVDALTEITSTPQVVNCFRISQGDQINQRTGQSILIKSVQLKGLLTSTASNPNWVRILLVLDKQTISDSTAALSDILDVSTNTYFTAPLKVDNFGRFKILYDRQFMFNDASNQYKKLNVFKKFKQHHVRYNGTGTGDIQKGDMNFFLVSQNGTPNGVDFDYFMRTRYHDN